MFDCAKYLTIDVVDMAELEQPGFDGILMPMRDIPESKTGITQQFLEDAEHYHERHFNTGYLRNLLTTAITRAAYGVAAPLIFDLGSGSGNSVFACAEMFPDSRIIATDLSPNLLAIMKRHADTLPEIRDRIGYVCMDASRDYVQRESFDLVVGAAILHHLIDPRLALELAQRILRPGGIAIFFEPFENGSAILQIVYSQILERVRAGAQLPEDVTNFFAMLVEGLRLRTGTDKSAEIFRRIDDKWLFTRTYIDVTAAQIGFSDTLIYPIHGVEHPFRDQTEVLLQLGLGALPAALPRWAWELINYYDGVFSPELKQDLLVEGAIILRR